MTYPLRLLLLVIVLVVMAVYHVGGLHFVYWPDSSGYLAQAQSLGGSEYQRPSARHVAYPLFVAGVLALSHTAVGLIVAQALLVAFAYALLAWFVGQARSDISLAAGAPGPRPDVWPAILLAATTAYSALHVFVLSMLPEVLHAVLALVAVVAVSRLVLRDPTVGLVWPAVVAATAAALPALVKPHWLLAAPVLVAVVAAKLVWSQLSKPPTGRPIGLPRAVALGLLPFLILVAALAPDRYLAAADPRADLFGPRTLFCNNLHLIADVVSGKRAWRLASDPDRDARLKAAASKVLITDEKPWKYLGFNGDHCMFNGEFLATVTAELPDPAAERAFYMAGFRAAVLGNPVRFTGKVLRQIALGVEQSFAKFSYHLASPGGEELPRAFFARTSRDGEAGPLRSKERMKRTPLGLVVMALLGLIFFPLSAAFAALFLLSLIVAPLRFRGWTPGRRRQFLAWVGVPVLAILGHHTLIGISHSFDIWRYAFGVFFISIGFVVTAGLFWQDELGRARCAARPLVLGNGRP